MSASQRLAVAAVAHALGSVPWQAVGRSIGLPYRSPSLGVVAATGLGALGTAAAVSWAGIEYARRACGHGGDNHAGPNHGGAAGVTPLGWAALGWFPVLGPGVTGFAEWRTGRRLASGTTGGAGRLQTVVATCALTGARLLSTRLLEAALSTSTPQSPPPPEPPTRLNVVPASLATSPAAGSPAAGSPAAGFVVYFDGVGRVMPRTTSVGRAFAAAIAQRLPGWTIVMSVMPNDVTQRPAWQRPVTGPTWRRLMRHDPSLLVARGVWEAIVSLDPRYRRRIALDHTAAVLAHLRAAGYQAGSGTPVVFVGLSAGAQTALHSVSDVARALGAPIDVVCLGGFFDGTADLSAVRRVHTALSWGDPAELAPVPLFPSRWVALGVGAWSRAIRRRQVVRYRHDFVTHVGRSGYLGEDLSPDGRTRRDQAADLVMRAAGELTEHVHRGGRPAGSRVRP